MHLLKKHVMKATAQNIFILETSNYESDKFMKY